MDAKLLAVITALAAIGQCSVLPPLAPTNQVSGFSYDVADPNTGDYKSQVEHRVGNAVAGQYSLIDPDGTKRTVDYTADSNGFNAVVRKDPIVTGVATPVVSSAVGNSAVVASPVAAASVVSPAVSYSRTFSGLYPPISFAPTIRYATSAPIVQYASNPAVFSSIYSSPVVNAPSVSSIRTHSVAPIPVATPVQVAVPAREVSVPVATSSFPTVHAEPSSQSAVASSASSSHASSYTPYSSISLTPVINAPSVSSVRTYSAPVAPIPVATPVQVAVPAREVSVPVATSSFPTVRAESSSQSAVASSASSSHASSYTPYSSISLTPVINAPSVSSVRTYSAPVAPIPVAVPVQVAAPAREVSVPVEIPSVPSVRAESSSQSNVASSASSSHVTGFTPYYYNLPSSYTRAEVSSNSGTSVPAASTPEPSVPAPYYYNPPTSFSARSAASSSGATLATAVSSPQVSVPTPYYYSPSVPAVSAQLPASQQGSFVPVAAHVVPSVYAAPSLYQAPLQPAYSSQSIYSSPLYSSVPQIYNPSLYSAGRSLYPVPQAYSYHPPSFPTRSVYASPSVYSPLSGYNSNLVYYKK